MRTVGITEQRFVVDRSTTYKLYDLGGSRSQRKVWASYFDDARAIIFLANIAAFDQVRWPITCHRPLLTSLARS